ncbi:beta-galactosidase 10 isoform X1 [Ipomoea triloba]|uniref:beta-galactosidase 10 isoform X1 n=2 Tax=Ipomoea triloba TaxID=35885 RepID=UPI00125CEFBB|nr:beta-galactosidase 10 isoform X1 [Ipomoea triloba]XP_031092540.1 beta-galactosidase 10 isoform X1 [Ipomoea triloba]
MAMALTMKHSIYRSSWESKCKVILLALLILVTGASGTSGGGAAANTTITSSEATNNNSNYSVTYDRRSLIVNGHRKLLISASIHYPRSVPAMWPGLVQLAKEGGADVIETYVFWNGHEPFPGKYYFGGRYDLVKFCKIVQQAGMYMILRIGPFIAAEWNFGGIPVWLHYVPGTIFRTDNEPFKHYMQNFMTFIVNLMKQERLFASQGGPIILAQVENEYGFYEAAYGDGGKRYALWAAKMAVSQNTGVPWIMCEQFDAPIEVIDTCNLFYCDQFTPLSPNKPKIWTENWPGWFKTFGASDPHRPPEDIAFSVARFFQKGGSVQNYYMYHGGTNFGRTSGGPFITTSYDYEAPIDEYGLARFPKWEHLKQLHKAIKLCEHALLNNEPTLLSLGPLQEADVYEDASGGSCAAFLANTDDKNDKVVIFRKMSYNLPAWSVSILPDCRNVVFNTAKVSSQTSLVEMIPSDLQPSSASPVRGLKGLQWEVFEEIAGIWGNADFIRRGFVDHINTTKDTTDYLWYTTSLFVDENEESLINGSNAILQVESKGHVLHVFINKMFQATASGNGSVPSFKLRSPISLKAGKNEISLLSMTMGLQNAGSFYEWVGAGLTSVKVEGFKNGTVDLSSNTWTYKVGLKGESLRIYQGYGLNSKMWVPTSAPPKGQPLTWYKAVVNAPPGDEPVGLDMIHMGKGMAWLNGEEIGRYWPRKSSKNDKCVLQCDYRGKFSPNKCNKGCGEPTQRWYHVPRSWFKPAGNILVIFEEIGGDLTQIKFSLRKVSSICAHVPEDHPPHDLEHLQHGEIEKNIGKPTLKLKCPTNTRVSLVTFASFGTPTGTCGSYTEGNCHDPNSVSLINKACMNQSECAVELSNRNFNMGLCPNTTKNLAVEVQCS